MSFVKRFRDLSAGDIIESEAGIATVISNPAKGFLEGHLSVNVSFRKKALGQIWIEAMPDDLVALAS